MSNTVYAIAGIVILLVAVFATAYTLNQVHGYVDGNNNSKDDVLEYWNSTMLQTDSENQQRRYDSCVFLNKTGITEWDGLTCHLKESEK